MKMKKLRKIMALVMAGAMALNGAAVSAEGETEQQSQAEEFGDYLNEALPQALSDPAVNVPNEMREYVRKTLPYYLAGMGLYGSYDVSDLIQIHNWEGGEDTEKYLVIVSENCVMVGSVTVEYVDNRIISAFREESIPAINEALASGAEIQLGYSNGCFLVYSGNKMHVVDNNDFVDESFADSLTADSALSEAIAVKETAAAAVQSRAMSWSVSGVKYVKNEPNPDNGVYTCWAACIASMGMQKNPGSVYTAISIYKSCRDSTSPNRPSDDYPTGVPEWINFGLQYIVGIVPAQTSALSSEEVKGILGSNKPIYVSLKSTSRDKKHALVLCYYMEIDSNSGQYVFMDPNSSSRLSVMIDGSVMRDGTNITVICRNGKDYDIWRRSFYQS